VENAVFARDKVQISAAPKPSRHGYPIQFFFSQHARNQKWQLILLSGQKRLVTCFAENKNGWQLVIGRVWHQACLTCSNKEIFYKSLTLCIIQLIVTAFWNLLIRSALTRL
jgi:hypothetical protein